MNLLEGLVKLAATRRCPDCGEKPTLRISGQWRRFACHCQCTKAHLVADDAWEEWHNFQATNSPRTGAARKDK